MNRQMIICLGLSLGLIGGTACVLARVQRAQKLAPPGVATHPLTGSIRLHPDLPEHVLDYSSKELETEDFVLKGLPQDTSFGWRRYQNADGFSFDLRVVLMGRDRTSLHRPQFCLRGLGWNINQSISKETTVKVEHPFAYQLPVVALMASRTMTVEGRSQLLSGVYVYWYVADDAMSASTLGLERMWWMASKLMRTGVLQRWAYISCFAACAPGQEAATFDRLKAFIAAAVPRFQQYPRPLTSSGQSAPAIATLGDDDALAAPPPSKVPETF
jgi:hypothetical protein